MSRLRVYTVHVNPALPNPYEEASFVEEGFSWRAFFFSALWTLYHRLWLMTGIILLVNAIISFFSLHGISHDGAICLFLAWNMVIGFHANDWLRDSLKKRGYITADIVTGDSLLRAEQRFFDRYFSGHEGTPVAAS